MRLALVAGISAILASATAEQRVSYDGYKAYSIATGDDGQEIRDKLSDLDFVALTVHEIDNHFDVAIAPDSVLEFEALGLETQLISEDLGAEFAEESAFEDYYGVDDSSPEKRQSSALPALSWFNSYHTYADHRTYWNNLNTAFSSNSEIFVAGKSYEGRDIYGLHFWGKGGKGKKPAIYFHATVHAREWIAAPVEEYHAWQLINGYLTNDTQITAIVDSYDFYFIPFVNPDGFVYTQSTNRLWRKNRQPRSTSSCVGTDNNRNWPYQWSVSGGASTNPCDEDYRGLAASDTPEITSLVAFTKSINTNGIKLYIDFHSYGQYILQPYGYSCTLYPANINQQRSAANQMANRIYAYSGARYTTGSSCGALYATTGDSTDYLTGVSGAAYAWTIELRPASSSGGGFVLPAAQILPTAREQWEGLKTLFSVI
ncbi:zinc carboxypeptidase A [Dactylonectria macrodidyma]|uniref:Zinc carboxypeptidase A n=1 Tax=Dactylonectria macrodidyma TaxID=307937 RepID=A0A9P9DYC0_9HYPO|nr:zinc carboxypeptidase A [Dactylonectria macrodidyma]